MSDGSPLDIHAQLDRLTRLLPFTGCSFFARALGALHLNLMRVDDGAQQPREPAFDLRAARTVVHFNTVPFGPN